MKDDAFALQTFQVEALPIPKAEGATAERVTELAEALRSMAADRDEAASKFLHDATEKYGLLSRPKRLRTYWKLGSKAFVDLLRKGGLRTPTAAAQAELLREFRQRRDHMRKLLNRFYRLEIELHHKVFDLYRLAPEEIRLLRETAPPRDPLRLAEAELASLEREVDE